MDRAGEGGCLGGGGGGSGCGGVGGVGGDGGGGGKREIINTYRYTVTTRMASALRWAAT